MDGELNDLKGSNENDGLVAKESQFYPKNFYNPATGAYEEVHSKVLLDVTGKGYCETNKNHKAIFPSDDTVNEFVIPMLRAARVCE